MALPKKHKYDPFAGKVGNEREQELIDYTSDKSIYLPRTIGLEDLDESMMQYVSDNLSFEVEGKVVPVFFMTKERWADLTLTWQQTDEKGNVVMPYMTLRRASPPRRGTNEAIKYRIGQNKKFTYTKVPVYENGVFGYDIYQTPQPIPIDIEYEVRFFTHMILDMNDFNEKVQYNFASGQDYIMTKGYYMPLAAEDMDEDGTMDEFESQRFYSQSLIITLMGFIQDGKNFEVVKSLRNIKLNIKGV